MSQTQTILDFNGRKITLIGTAHVSDESVKEVTETINSLKPDCVAIELDEKRCDSIKNPEKFRELDLVKVLKSKQGWLMMANLVLSSFQKRMGVNTGVKPGDEMVAAMNAAETLNIPTVMVDRPIQITFKRAWSENNLWGKCKLLSALLTSAFSKDQVSSEQIEQLKEKSEMDSMMNELSDFMPDVKRVLIDERDQYLASHIWEAKGNNIIAVLGAGHVPGVTAYLEKIAKGESTTDTTEIGSVKPKSFGSKLAMWIIPVLIVAIIALGFVFGGKDVGSEQLLSWVLWNGTLSALGALIALAHPVTILVSFVSAPITSLCPFIGVGIVAGIVQAVMCKPKVKDMESLSTDAYSLKGWYKNRILRVFLVLLLSTLGSSIGTFTGGASIITQFVDAVKNFFHK